MNRALKTLPALLALAASAAPAFAYEYPQCLGYSKRWDRSSLTMHPSSYSFDTQYPQFKQALEEARSGWTYAPGNSFPLSFTYRSASYGASNDGYNSIVIADGYNQAFPSSSDALAVELTRYDSCTAFVEYGTILESDVYFNFYNYPSYYWSSNPWPTPADMSYFNFATVALHELGHSFGLAHEDDLLATMNSVYPNGGPIGRDQVQPHADDIRGVRAGYGSSGSVNDLAASPYRYNGSGNSARLVPPASTLYRTRSYTFPFTIENRGTTSFSSVTVGFYLTPDRVVTPNETYLGSATFSLGVGAITTANVTLNLPLSVTPGSYYLGWIVDPNNTVSEGDRVNNGTTYGTAFTIPTAVPPTACISANPTLGTEPLWVNYSGACSSDPNGSIVSYSWDLGDGGTDTAVSGTNVYWAGFWDLTLTVTDSEGLTDTRTVLIRVNPATNCPDPRQINCYPEVE